MIPAFVLATVLTGASMGAQTGATPDPGTSCTASRDIIKHPTEWICTDHGPTRILPPTSRFVRLTPDLVVDPSGTTLLQRIRDAWAQCLPDPATPNFDTEKCLENDILDGDDLPGVTP